MGSTPARPLLMPHKMGQLDLYRYGQFFTEQNLQAEVASPGWGKGGPTGGNEFGDGTPVRRTHSVDAVRRWSIFAHTGIGILIHSIRS